MEQDIRDYNLKSYEVASELELKELCGKEQGIILGITNEYRTKYSIVEIQHKNIKRIYGIIYGGHRLKAFVTKIDKRDLFVISFDNKVCFLNLEGNNIIKQVCLDSLVYEILTIQSNYNHILIICELEVRCLSLDNFQVWRYDCDVITDFKLFRNYLEISTHNGDIKISLKDGSLLL